MSSLDDTKTIRTGRKSDSSTKDRYQVVCFCLDGVEYGLEVSCVEEIIRPEEIGGVGDKPARGRTTTWRDKKLTIVDLRERLGYSRAVADGETRIIIVSIDERLIGAVVDSVLELSRLNPGQVDRETKKQTGVDADLIKGTYQEDDRSVFILDETRLFES